MPQQLISEVPTISFEYAGQDGGLLEISGVFSDGSQVILTQSTYISYSSDTPGVATVDPSGVVASLAPGSANIMVTYANPPAAAISLTVPVFVPQPVSVLPSTSSLYISQTEKLAASLAIDPDLDQSVTWSLSPQLGNIDQTGLYTAPSSVASWQGVTVTATSVANPAQSASAQIWIFPPVSIGVSPPSVTMSAAQAQTFTPAVANGGTDVTWAANPSGVGTIQLSQVTDPNNQYLSIGVATYFAPAPISAAQTVTITATSVYDNSKTASAQVTLVPSVAVSVSPSAASLYASQSQQFAVAINYSPGGAVTWSLSPNVGTISANGLYAAPAIVAYQQTVSVIATGPDIGTGTSSGTATVTLVPRISASITVPTGLTAGAASNSEIDLTWTGSTEPGGGIAGYIIFRNGVFVGTAAGTSYADLGLIAGASYTYTVAAYDTSGNTSVQSAGVGASTLSGIPLGLVAYYDFNEGAGTVLHDSSGNGNNGAITAATWSTNGKYGAALVFDGATSYVTAPNVNAGAAMTLEAWVSPPAVESGAVAVEYYGGYPWVCFGLYDSGYGGFAGDVTTNGFGPQVGVRQPGFIPLTSNVWTHLALTYDGTAVRIFNNGVQVASEPQSGAVDNASLPLYIGGDPLTPSGFTGMIDELRIYNIALSQAQIQNDMAGPANVTISLSPPTTTLNSLQTQQFAATITGSSNTGVTWSVALETGAPTGAQPGTISPTGLYAPPSSVAAQYTVIVTAVRLKVEQNQLVGGIT